MPLEETKQKALEAISYLDAGDAQEAARDLDFEIKKMSGMPDANQEELNYLSYLLVRLKLLSLPNLADEDMARLFKTRLIWLMIDEEIDVTERIETRQLTCPESLRFEVVNQSIIDAIHENQEQIGQKKIFIQGSNEAVVPTIKNWILDYDRVYGTRPQRDLVWLGYTTSSRNAMNLNPEEKSMLRKILKLYEFLKTVKKQAV